VRETSRKPDEVYGVIERYVGLPVYLHIPIPPFFFISFSWSGIDVGRKEES
jgi:hypothetical protein